MTVISLINEIRKCNILCKKTHSWRELIVFCLFPGVEATPLWHYSSPRSFQVRQCFWETVVWTKSSGIFSSCFLSEQSVPGVPWVCFGCHLQEQPAKSSLSWLWSGNRAILGSFLQFHILRSCWKRQQVGVVFRSWSVEILRKAGKHGWSRKHQRVFPPFGAQTLQEATAEREELKPGKQGV